MQIVVPKHLQLARLCPVICYGFRCVNHPLYSLRWLHMEGRWCGHLNIQNQFGSFKMRSGDKWCATQCKRQAVTCMYLCSVWSWCAHLGCGCVSLPCRGSSAAQGERAAQGCLQAPAALMAPGPSWAEGFAITHWHGKECRCFPTPALRRCWRFG